MKRLIKCSSEGNSLLEQVKENELYRAFADYRYWIVREKLDKLCDTLDEAYDRVYSRTIGNPRSGHYNSHRDLEDLDRVFDFARNNRFTVKQLVDFTKQVFKEYDRMREMYTDHSNIGPDMLSKVSFEEIVDKYWAKN